MGDFAAALRRNAEDAGRELPGALSRRPEERPAWVRREASPVEAAPAPAPVQPEEVVVATAPAPVDPEPRTEWFPPEDKSEPTPEPERLLPNLGSESEQLLRDVLGLHAAPRPAAKGTRRSRSARRAAAPPSGRRPSRAGGRILRASVAAAGAVLAVLAGFVNATRDIQQQEAAARKEPAPLFSHEPAAQDEAAPRVDEPSVEPIPPEQAEPRPEWVAEIEDPEFDAEEIDFPDGVRDVRGALRDLERGGTGEERADLYSALAFDAHETYENARPEEIAEKSLSEAEPEARVQGFRLVASMLRFDSDGTLAKTFDDTMVPWLKDEAMSEGSRYSRLVAVDALKLASTWAATEALHDISRSPETQVAEAADRALFAQNRLR